MPAAAFRRQAFSCLEERRVGVGQLGRWRASAWPCDAPRSSPGRAASRRRRRRRSSGPAAGRPAVAEVVEDAAAPAAIAVDERLDRAVVAPAALAGDRQLGIALLDEAHEAAEVGLHRQQHRLRRQPVAAAASGLLVVGLEAGRDRHVPDRAHVGLVDSHAEGVGGDDHFGVAFHEAALGRGAVLGLHAGVVGERPQARLAQRLGDLVGVAAGAAVDDRRPVRGIGEPAFEQGQPPRLRALALQTHDVEGEVGPVEAGAHLERLLEDPKRATISAATALVAVAVQAITGGPPEPLGDLGQAQVVGAEIVPPFGDAMRLVDGEQVDPPLRQGIEEDGRGEALRRAVDDPRRAVCAPGRGRRGRPPGSSPRRSSPPGARPRSAAATGPCISAISGLTTIVRSSRGQPRQLVAEALAAAGRHHDQRVAPLEPASTASRCPGRQLSKPSAPSSWSALSSAVTVIGTRLWVSADDLGGHL